MAYLTDNNHIVTRNSLQEMVDGPNAAQVVGRALVVLFKRQTEAEKMENTTKIYNNIGFTKGDGRTGCIAAKTFLKHGTLNDWQLRKWTKTEKSGYSRIVKYWRQLDEAAKEKRAAANPN